ncbi:MAG: YraN family protein [Agathobacter sp.]|nr:YraN family protein [Agathobacter sp.]
MNKREVGSKYENIAVSYLQEQGYTILEQNYRNRIGEIDIIAKDKEYLCFIEVKYRKDNGCGTPMAAVNYPKQKNISKVSMYYMMKNGLSEWTPCRYDVVAIEGEKIALYKNAFEAIL